MFDYLDDENTVFAFNIWDINSAKAVMDAAKAVGRNIILQTSAGIYTGLDKEELRVFVSSYSKRKGIKAWLHMDHCKKPDMLKDAIDYGWDSVMIDASDQDIDENINITNTVTTYAHKRNVSVEAEIGQVKGVEDNISICREAIADRKDIKRFLDETEIDMIAVAFGNAHGIYHGEPQLHFDLVEYTVNYGQIPFVVHGGSGLTDNVLKRLISIPGVKKINISTDVKLAYRQGILNAGNGGALDMDGFQAVKVEKYIHDAIMHMACSKLKLLDE